MPQGSRRASGCRGEAPRDGPRRRNGRRHDGRGPASRSHLTNWPIQLHLLSPMAPQFKGKDVLLSADCVAYAVGGLPLRRSWTGKALAIACPKLDDGAGHLPGEAHRAHRPRADQLPHRRDDGGPLLPRAPGAWRSRRAAKAHRKVPLKAMIVSIDDGRSSRRSGVDGGRVPASSAWPAASATTRSAAPGRVEGLDRSIARRRLVTEEKPARRRAPSPAWRAAAREAAWSATDWLHAPPRFLSVTIVNSTALVRSAARRPAGSP